MQVNTARALPVSDTTLFALRLKRNMKIKSILATTLALASVLSLSGCLFYPPTDGSFPDPDRAWTKEGSFPNLDNLRRVATGQTKSQIYELIGPPHFNEAVFHVREWNYLLHLRHGDQTMVCQFQIRFDRHSRVTATRWRDQACADLVGAITADGQSSATPSAQ
ncbi:outer membrane protein assembly factor BamE [Paraburkholderia sp. 2C]